jgi:hypothetical protein
MDAIGALADSQIALGPCGSAARAGGPASSRYSATTMVLIVAVTSGATSTTTMYVPV